MCEQRIKLAHLGCSERYAQRVRCGGHDLLFTRMEFHYSTSPGRYQGRMQLIYRRATDSSNHYGPPRPLLEDVSTKQGYVSPGTIGDAAIACNSAEQLLFISPENVDDFHISRRIANVTSSGRLAWASPWMRVSSTLKSEIGCVDRLGEGWDADSYFGRLQKIGACPFDSKASIARSPVDGRWLLYGRANLRPQGGGRHVQVMGESYDQHGRFTQPRFQLLRIEGFEAGDEQGEGFDGVSRVDQNIYYFSVRPIRVLSHALLLGCFPGNHGRTAGVFCTISKDGVDWARPVLLVTSELHDGRVGDQPFVDSVRWRDAVGRDVGVEGRLTVGIQHGVHTPHHFEDRSETAQARQSRLAQHCRRSLIGNYTECLNCFREQPLPTFCEHHYEVHARTTAHSSNGTGLQLSLTPTSAHVGRRASLLGAQQLNLPCVADCKPPCEAWCAAHPQHWARKCSSFRYCTGCLECQAGASRATSILRRNSLAVPSQLVVLLVLINNQASIANGNGDPRFTTLLAVCHELQRRDHVVLIAGTSDGMKAVPRNAPFRGFDWISDEMIAHHGTPALVVHWMHYASQDGRWGRGEHRVVQRVAMSHSAMSHFKFSVPDLVYENGMVEGSVTVDPRGLLGESFYVPTLNTRVQEGFDAVACARLLQHRLARNESKRPQPSLVDIPLSISSRYVLIPTQKFNDYSVAHFSNVSFPALLRHAARFCAERGLPLVVKIHPHLVGVERAEQVQLIMQLKRAHPGIFISEASIIYLTIHARFTVTINGGTLIDNFLSQTPVLTLGESLFHKTDAVIYDVDTVRGMQRMLLAEASPWPEDRKLRQRQIVWWYERHSLNVRKSARENVAVMQAHLRAIGLESLASQL